MAGEQVPIGGIILWTDASEPTDFVECNGQAISRATFATLFALIASTFGDGDGSTTFNVPDLRGRATIGVGTGAGLTARALADAPGAEDHTLLAAEMPSHAHEGGAGGGGVFTRAASSGETPLGVAAGAIGSAKVAASPSDSQGGDAAHENMQPSLALHHLIRVSIT